MTSDPVTLWDLLERCAADRPQQPALVLPDDRITWGELRERAPTLAAGLEESGVGPGDRVALATTNSVTWAVWYFALARLGAVTVPVDPRSAAPELASVLDRCGAVAVLTGSSCTAAPEVFPGRTGLLRVWDGGSPAPEWATGLDVGEGPARDGAHGRPSGVASEPGPAVAATRSARRPGDGSARDALGATASSGPATPPPGPEDAAIIQYTSGSTAAPKGAVLPHRAVVAVARGFASRLDLQPGDRMFSGSPFFHVGGTVLLLATAAAAGATAVALPAFDAEAALGLIERERCVLFSGVEPHFLLVLAADGFSPARVASVTKATSTGSPTVLRRIADEMEIPGLVALYGLSETASNLTMCAVGDPEDQRLETCGRPHDGCEVRIRRPDTGEPAEPGEVGEIVARGATTMLGYWDQPDETAAAFTADGLLRTGDLGSIDDDGLLRFAGRAKDMLRVGGENVATAEVEQVLLELDEISSAAVVGRGHPKLGEVPVAFVTLTARADPERVDQRVAAHLAARLSRFKRPREVVVLDEMPLTGSGKIHKPTLRDRLDGG